MDIIIDTMIAMLKLAFLGSFYLSFPGFPLTSLAISFGSPMCSFRSRIYPLVEQVSISIPQICVPSPLLNVMWFLWTALSIPLVSTISISSVGFDVHSILKQSPAIQLILLEFLTDTLKP